MTPAQQYHFNQFHHSFSWWQGHSLQQYLFYYDYRVYRLWAESLLHNLFYDLWAWCLPITEESQKPNTILINIGSIEVDIRVILKYLEESIPDIDQLFSAQFRQPTLLSKMEDDNSYCLLP